MTKLSEKDFDIALRAFEGMMGGEQNAENQEKAERETLERVEMMAPGFTVDYLEYKENQRNRIVYMKDASIIRNEGGFESWYTGANKTSGVWPRYRDSLSLPQKAVDDIDESTFQILRQAANPRKEGDKRKGLVVGYVQSGKTANFQALIAKAVDAGYRIIIVLAGMHNNLRTQTQTRLQDDLGLSSSAPSTDITWHPLTTEQRDMTFNEGGKNEESENRHVQLNNYSNVAVMVVKKNARRLKNVEKFLGKIDQDVISRRPVLIIDDESDQATPNTMAAKQAVSTINRCIRDIWKKVKVGTYVAYTATPFANVLIDPTDKEDLYPEDFVVTLPKPEGYLGADEFFNTSSYASDDEEDELVASLSESIPVEEAKVLAPQSRDLSSYNPEVTDTLKDAIYWFILATAIREIRVGERKHSSMLIHTSHRTDAHFMLKDRINNFVQTISLDLPNHKKSFQKVFEIQKDRATVLRGNEITPDWDSIWEKIQDVIAKLTVKVDNGYSDDRLVYPKKEPQTVIAIGGGTLSRGLTLEGLVVSYFLRTSNTYDTLLQMGRWFGFRPHYADLVRVWVGPGLLDEYRHLAIVERQIREEIKQMEYEEKTPRELAIKILAHPGRLDITSPSKMSAAQIVQAGLGGSRKQTIYLNREKSAIEKSHEIVRMFVGNALNSSSGVISDKKGNHLIRGISNSEVISFFRDFWVADRWMQADSLEKWLSVHGDGKTWDIVLVSGKNSSPHEFSYTNDISVKTVSRAPRKAEQWDQSNLHFEIPENADLVNIRALLSSDDSTLDFKILEANGLLSKENQKLLEDLKRSDVDSVKFARELVAPDTGLVILYAIDKDSEPQKKSVTRTFMHAPNHIIGAGLVFPSAEGEDPNDYVSVAHVYQAVHDDEDETDVDAEVEEAKILLAEEDEGKEGSDVF